MSRRKYHVNPTTGEMGVCTATVKPCPLGGSDVHFTSKAAAQKKSEEIQKELAHESAINKGKSLGGSLKKSLSAIKPSTEGPLADDGSEGVARVNESVYGNLTPDEWREEIRKFNDAQENLISKSVEDLNAEIDAHRDLEREWLEDRINTTNKELNERFNKPQLDKDYEAAKAQIREEQQVRVKQAIDSREVYYRNRTVACNEALKILNSDGDTVDKLNKTMEIMRKSGVGVRLGNFLDDSRYSQVVREGEPSGSYGLKFYSDFEKSEWKGQDRISFRVRLTPEDGRYDRRSIPVEFVSTEALASRLKSMTEVDPHEQAETDVYGRLTHASRTEEDAIVEMDDYLRSHADYDTTISVNRDCEYKLSRADRKIYREYDQARRDSGIESIQKQLDGLDKKYAKGREELEELHDEALKDQEFSKLVSSVRPVGDDDVKALRSKVKSDATRKRRAEGDRVLSTDEDYDVIGRTSGDGWLVLSHSDRSFMYSEDRRYWAAGDTAAYQVYDKDLTFKGFLPAGTNHDTGSEVGGVMGLHDFPSIISQLHNRAIERDGESRKWTGMLS